MRTPDRQRRVWCIPCSRWRKETGGDHDTKMGEQSCIVWFWKVNESKNKLPTKRDIKICVSLEKQYYISVISYFIFLWHHTKKPKTSENQYSRGSTSTRQKSHGKKLLIIAIRKWQRYERWTDIDFTIGECAKIFWQKSSEKFLYEKKRLPMNRMQRYKDKSIFLFETKTMKDIAETLYFVHLSYLLIIE